MTLTAAVLAVGDELLLGDVVNTNAAWLGGRLAAAGVQVVASAAVGDHLGRLAVALRRALQDADVVLLSGGLGPTSDDLTRDAVAVVAGAPLVRSAALEQGLRERFASYGQDLPAQVLRQADVPRGARALDNPAGTAPGLWLEVGDHLVVALPGPPHELRAVAGPVLEELARRSGSVVVTRTLHTAGLGEPSVAEIVERAVRVPEGVALAYLAGGGTTRVRFTGSDRSVLEPLAAAAAAALGDAVWGRDQDTLPGVVHALLRDRSATVGAAESLTAGLLADALAALPGSSATFRGGLVVYATDLKESLAAVPRPLLQAHGAVSAETAGALAAGARTRLGASYGVATTGVAGPDDQEGKPAGTVFVAVAGPDGGAVRALRLPGNRDRVRALAVTAALDLLRRQLTP